MPWRHPVGLDALLPSCRACKAAALFVWHRHAGPHRRDPLRRSHAPSTSLHRVAVPCSTPSPRLVPRLFCARRPVRLVLQGKVAPLRGCASVVPLLRSMGSPPLCSMGSPPLCSMGSPPFRSCGVASTLLHRYDEARKTADLSRRSPSPGGELQQKCEAMGTVALHRGFPLMRMIFFDKTPPWDPCLWGEVE